LTPQSTNSTRWPEPMRGSVALSEGESGISSSPQLGTLISELEQSLRAGQRALLLRDLERYEAETAAQASMSRALAECLRDWAPDDDTLREAGLRVVHLCRVQIGLLHRAQRALRVLSNLLASAEGTYLPANCAGTAEPDCAMSRNEG